MPASSDPAPDVFAIDFGTSNSLLAAANADRTFPAVPLDPTAPDPTVLRSILFFPSALKVFYGTEALKQYVEHGQEGRLIRSIKKHLPSRLFTSTSVAGRTMKLEDLIGAVLREMRKRGNAFFGTDVRRVVLGRPARFSDRQEDDEFAERRLRRAAELAGFEEVITLPEPVAAARDFRDRLDQPRIVVVADFGGGTSDFTVLRMRPPSSEADESSIDGDVLAMGGVSLAGDALDGALMRARIADHFGANVQYKVPLGHNVLTMPKPIIETLCSPADLSLLSRRDIRSFLEDIRGWSLGQDDQQKIDQLFVLVDDALGFSIFEEIESAKKSLSERDVVAFDYDTPGISIRDELDRALFDDATRITLSRIIEELDRTLEAAETRAADVDILCLTGGTARVPRLAAELEKRFERATVYQHNNFHSVLGGLADRAQSWARTGI